MRAGPPNLSLWAPRGAVQATSLAARTWWPSQTASITTGSAVEPLIALCQGVDAKRAASRSLLRDAGRVGAEVTQGRKAVPLGFDHGGPAVAGSVRCAGGPPHFGLEILIAGLGPRELCPHLLHHGRAGTSAHSEGDRDAFDVRVGLGRSQRSS